MDSRLTNSKQKRKDKLDQRVTERMERTGETYAQASQRVKSQNIDYKRQSTARMPVVTYRRPRSTPPPPMNDNETR